MASKNVLQCTPPTHNPFTWHIICNMIFFYCRFNRMWWFLSGLSWCQFGWFFVCACNPSFIAYVWLLERFGTCKLYRLAMIYKMINDQESYGNLCDFTDQAELIMLTIKRMERWISDPMISLVQFELHKTCLINRSSFNSTSSFTPIWLLMRESFQRLCGIMALTR